MADQDRRTRRKWHFPIALGVVLGAVALAFPDLALMAFVAVLIVYLIEPVVALLCNVGVMGRTLPRWGAVVTVYTAMIGGTIAFGAIVAPVLAQEATTLANEVPEIVRDLREDVLPSVDSRIQALRAVLQPDVVAEAPVETARDAVANALTAARLHALFISTLSDEERAQFDTTDVTVTTVDPQSSVGPVLFSLHPNASGGVDVVAGTDTVAVRPSGDGGFLIGPASARVETGAAFGEAFTASIDGALEASGERVAEVLHVGQRLVGKLLTAVVGVFVTFMVAAFISIDIPRIVAFLISLFPREDEPTVRRLLSRLNYGLSGVIRGQLAICLINAVLTGIGLLLLNVKFALLLAVIAGVMSLIPIFGTILSTIPCVLLGLTQGIGTAVLIVVWIIVIHFIEANILQPKIMGSTARIHPVVVILALLAGEHAFGIVGALVAVPLASVMQSLLFFVRDEYAHNEPLDADDVDDTHDETTLPVPQSTGPAIPPTAVAPVDPETE